MDLTYEAMAACLIGIGLTRVNKFVPT